MSLAKARATSLLKVIRCPGPIVFNALNRRVGIVCHGATERRKMWKVKWLESYSILRLTTASTVTTTTEKIN